MNKKNIINYSVLAIPLAFVGLPIYINVSDFYIRQFDVNMAFLAFIILAVRLLDAVQEPLLGLLSDYLIKKNISHKKIIYVSASFLALSFFALFNPPHFANPSMILLWLGLSMLTTYSFFNLTVINFEALAVIIAKNSEQRIEVNSYKEFFGLIGILIAASSPTLIKLLLKNEENNYFYLSLVFIFLLFFSIIFFFHKVQNEENKILIKFDFRKIFAEIFSNKIFLKFIGIFFINSLAVSLPASVITFYVNDVLKCPEKLGIFLTIYFLSAAIFMIFWKKIAQKIGKINSWSISILGSILTFIFAYFVDSSNSDLFFLICFLSGVFLGADLMMPPAIISEIIHQKHDKISSYLALWSMINKAGLMCASFLSLMVLWLVSFDAKNVNQDSLMAIPIIYAIIPCALKMLVVLLLYKLKNSEKNL
jgi:Na+/melibiose symporter-like transporter